MIRTARFPPASSRPRRRARRNWTAREKSKRGIGEPRTLRPPVQQSYTWKVLIALYADGTSSNIRQVRKTSRDSRAQARCGRPASFRCWSIMAMPVIEDNLHHRASPGSPSGPERLDSGRRTRPAGAVPRSLLRPLRPGQHAAGRSTMRFGPKARATLTAPSKAARTCGSPTNGSRRTCRMASWAAGDSFTLADCAAAPALVLRRLGRGDRRPTAEAAGLSRPAAGAS